jgi:restriction endonuclease-like protein
VTVSPKKDLQRRQRRWAENAGVAHDSLGFVRELDTNLRLPLSAATRAAFARGSELDARRARPARIAALHSSAALVANVFDHWSTRAASPLAAALGLEREPCTLSFEEPFATGVEGEPPYIDVALRFSSGRIVAIESKFSEWIARRRPSKADLKPKYFGATRALWSDSGLPQCQALAEGIRDGCERFSHLNAAQLLKHALGLARAAGGSFEIRYLYYDWHGRQAAAHRQEIAHFALCVGTEIPFKATTYQQLYGALKLDSEVDADYLDYLGARYFGAT